MRAEVTAKATHGGAPWVGVECREVMAKEAGRPQPNGSVGESETFIVPMAEPKRVVSKATPREGRQERGFGKSKWRSPAP